MNKTLEPLPTLAFQNTDVTASFVSVEKSCGVPWHLQNVTLLAWLRCGKDVYVLPCFEYGFFVVRRARDKSGWVHPCLLIIAVLTL
jgi:hypothetical protein